MRHYERTNWFCPTCGNLASLPWEHAWCLHSGSSNSFQPRPPGWAEADWTRMVRVTKVKTEPVVKTKWVVVEYQNSIGWDKRYSEYPGTPEPGDLDWNYRIGSAPMGRKEAYAEAERRPRREGWPRHMHDWHAYPVDVASNL